MLIGLTCVVVLFVCIVFQGDGFPSGIQFHYDGANETAPLEQFIEMDGAIISNNKTQYSWTLYRGNKTYIDDEDEVITFQDTWDNINTLFVAIAATVSLVLLVGCPLLCIRKNGKKENHPAVNSSLNPLTHQSISTISGGIIASPICQAAIPKRKIDKPPSYDAAIHLAVIEEEEEGDELPSYQEALELQLAKNLTKLEFSLETTLDTPVSV